MPKLPKGLFKRGESYTVRLRVDGKDVWRSLGTDLPEAKRKLRQIRSGESPLNSRLTVMEVRVPETMAPAFPENMAP